MKLSREAEGLKKRIMAEYDLAGDPAALLILQTAMEAFCRMRQAQEAIQKHGVIYLDRYQQPKANPAVAAERDSRAAMLAALKQLNLDVEIIPNPGPGRPPGR